MENLENGCGLGKDLPWEGRGTNLPISGCRFTLYPMTDDYVSIILTALEKTDTKAVWSETDSLSTVYRGKLPYVVDAVEALFINAYKEGVHMALEGQFSRGCPGDSSGDNVLNQSGEAPNQEQTKDKRFFVRCKLALYPMGDADYIDEIAKVWYMAEDRGLKPTTIHYATRIEGDVREVFSYLQEVCQLMEDSQSVHHYILHFTMNCNSPTKEE